MLSICSVSSAQKTFRRGNNPFRYLANRHRNNNDEIEVKALLQ